MNDSDFLASELRRRGKIISREARKGNCSHGWIGPAIQGNVDGEYKCMHCGTLFPDSEAAMDAHNEWIQRYT